MDRVLSTTLAGARAPAATVLALGLALAAAACVDEAPDLGDGADEVRTAQLGDPLRGLLRSPPAGVAAVLARRRPCCSRRRAAAHPGRAAAERSGAHRPVRADELVEAQALVVVEDRA